MNCTGFIFLILVLSAGRPLEASAQTYTCLDDTDPDAVRIRDMVVAMVTADPSDAYRSRGRVAYDLPVADSYDVSVVSTTGACQKAGPAYHDAVDPSASPPDRTLAVVKVGDRYVVRDPNYLPGDVDHTVVFDRHWNLIKYFAG